LKTVLVLAYEHAPFNRPGSTIGAQRTYQFAKHLPRFGWKCIVLCCDFKTRYSLDPRSDWKRQVDVAVGSLLGEEQLQQEMLAIPLPSLKYGGLFDKLWHRAVVMDPVRGTFSPRPGVFNGVIRLLATCFKFFTGDHSESWQPVATRAAEHVIHKTKVDAVLAEHGPDASLYVAHRLAKQLPIPWVADFRDPALQAFPPLLRGLMRWHLRRILKSCRLVINVNPFWVECDRADFNKEVRLIPNGFDEDEFVFNPQVVRNESFRIGAYGNISFPGDVDLLFRALKVLRLRKRAVQFFYFGNLAALFRRKANEYGLHEAVHIYDPMPRAEVLARVGELNAVVLFSSAPHLNTDPYLMHGYYPAKVFEVFGLRKSFAVVPGDQGLLNELALRSGYGVVTETDTALVETIERWIDQYNETGRVTLPVDEVFIQQFSRKVQAGALAKALFSIL